MRLLGGAGGADHREGADSSRLVRRAQANLPSTRLHSATPRREALSSEPVPQVTDASTRAQERAGGGILGRARAHDLWRYTTATNRGCAGCPGCGPPRDITCPGSDPADPHDALALLAFMGSSQAREAADGTLWGERAYVSCRDGRPTDCPMCSWCLVHDHDCAKVSLRNWVKHLESLVSAQPPRRTELRCECTGCTRPHCLGHGVRVKECAFCQGRCNGTRRAFSDTPASQWLMTLASLALAREVHRATCDCEPGSTTRFLPGDPRHHPSCDRLLATLTACQAWLKQPTADRLNEWEEGHPSLGLSTLWIPAPSWLEGWSSWADRFVSASQVLDRLRLRELVTQTIAEALLVGPA